MSLFRSGGNREPDPVPEATPPPGELSAAARLAGAEARIDQTRLHVKEVAKGASNNPELMKLCIDVLRLLHGPYRENADG